MSCPQLVAEQGCGTLTAATIIGRTAGAERSATDAQFARHAGTAPIPASSGRRDRRKRSEGRSNREAIRSLKRHLARRIWKLLQPAETLHNHAMTTHCNPPRDSFALT